MIRLLIADDMEDIRSYLSEEIAACARHIAVVGQAASGSEAVALRGVLLILVRNRTVRAVESKYHKLLVFNNSEVVHII